MYRTIPFTLRSVEARLSPWLKKFAEPALARQAERLPLRRDMVTLLEFVRDNKVVGTQSTGNLPLKAIREVTARFVRPPLLDSRIGDRVFQLRSEEDIWPLFFLHILADVGGLVKTGRARQWRLTAPGKRFLEATPRLQAAFLLAVWWHRVNWLVAYPFTGMGEALPYRFQGVALASLRVLPVGRYVSFSQFADGLIGQTGLTWTAPESTIATLALRGSIERMVIATLADFEAVKRRHRKVKLGRGAISELSAFQVTPWGMALLAAVGAVGG